MIFCERAGYEVLVLNDSQRRPLSCTPPASTSISTSVSIDEDETKPEKISDLEGITNVNQNEKREDRIEARNRLQFISNKESESK